MVPDVVQDAGESMPSNRAKRDVALIAVPTHFFLFCLTFFIRLSFTSIDRDIFVHARFRSLS